MILEGIAKDKKIVYNEGFQTGKRSLYLDNKEASKIGKKTFVFDDKLTVSIKGNFLTGVSLLFSDFTQETLVKNKWYEWIIIFLPFLVMGVGVLFGMIGGGLSALLAVTGAVINASILRSKYPFILKIILTILIILAVYFCFWLFLVGLEIL